MADITSNNMMALAHVRVADSETCVYISICMTTRNVHIFKYNDHACDYGVFDNQADACHFIARQLPRGPSHY
jgi:hypothetical protein